MSAGGRYAWQVLALNSDGASPATAAVEADVPEDLGDITGHGASGTRSGKVNAAVVYSFTLTDVRKVSFNLSVGNGSAEIRLEDSDGFHIIPDVNQDQQIVKVLEAGAYRLRVARLTASGSHEFTFSYEVNGNISEDEFIKFSDGADTLGRAQVGSRVSGAHEDADGNIDWIGVRLESGVLRRKSPTLWERTLGPRICSTATTMRTARHTTSSLPSPM